MSEDDVLYWRTLAEERGRALDELHERLRTAIALVPEDHVATFAAALSGRLAGWTREPHRMEPLSELRRSDVTSVLDELWARLRADRKP